MLLLLAINIPLFLHALASPGFPIGQLAFGYNALTPLSELEAQLQSLGIPLLTDIIGKPSPIFEWVGSIQVLSGLIVMTAVCLFPSMLQQYAVCATPELASRSIGKAILLVGLMLASAFALMAYTKFGIYQLTLGLSLSEARVDAPFLYSWSGRETNLVVLCENVMQNDNQLMTACLGKDQHILNTSDLQLNSRLLFAAAPDLNALPFAYTSFLSAAILLALISFSSGIILSTSNSIISAFYATLPGKVASARIFFTRLLIVGLSLFGAFLGLANPTDPGLLFMFSLSILAATLAPAMIAAVLMPSSTSVQATTGISMGFVICVLYYVLSKFGIDFTAGTGDEVSAKLPFMSEAIPSELGAILAIPVATLIVISMAGFSASTKVVPLESEDRLADH